MLARKRIPSELPEWFCLDRELGVSAEDITDKIKLEVYNEVINRGYDLTLWTDDFIQEISNVYYKNFERIYRNMLADLVA